MRLYFLRHAHAFAREDWQGEEAARPLTDKGRKQAEAAAAGLATLRPAIGAIISSPYARAYETAVIVGRVLGMPVESADDLTPGFDLSRLDHTLTLRPDVDGPLFVGHEPDLSQLVERLISPPGQPKTSVTLAKASCCLVIAPDDLPGGASAVELAGRCTLAWMRTWRELQALALGGGVAG
jgi:phosphohistidine phosphatase